MHTVVRPSSVALCLVALVYCESGQSCLEK